MLFRFLMALVACLTASPAVAGCRVDALDALPERATVRLPAALSSSPMPLVVLLHGSTGTGVLALRDSGLGATADRHGFIVAAPDGAIVADGGFVWNIPGVPTVTGAMPPRRARDDIAYVTGLVDRLVASGCVDAGRVYVTGISGGGRMASLLGCAAARRFAAIAPVVGLRAGRPLASDLARVDPTTCRPGLPLPVLAFAGDADTTNPIAGGGAPYWGYSQAAALQRWGALNGCAAPYARATGANAYEQGYARCRSGASVAARVVRGGEHSWSVADNEAMWTFFARHRR